MSDKQESEKSDSGAKVEPDPENGWVEVVPRLHEAAAKTLFGSLQKVVNCILINAEKGNASCAKLLIDLAREYAAGKDVSQERIQSLAEILHGQVLRIQQVDEDEQALGDGLEV